MKIIFDLDDTVQRTRRLRDERERAILSSLGNRAKEYKKLRELDTTTKSLEKLGIDRKNFYDILKSVPINLKRDKKLISLFQNLKEKYKIVILSNSPKECVIEILDQLGLIFLVDEVYGGDSFKVPKPSFEAFSVVEPGDICIGNNFRKDLEIPKRKGAITVLVSDEENKEADFNIRSVLELESVLSKVR